MELEVSEIGGDPDLIEAMAEMVGERERLLRGGVGQDDEELVSAEAGDEVGGAGVLTEAVGDGAEGKIAGVVAEVV